MAAKTNRLKNEETADTFSEEPKPSKKSKESTSKKRGLLDFFKDEQVQRLFGLFIILVSFYQMVAFISFMFTWKEDFSEVSGSWLDFLNAQDINAANWLGKFGAIISHQFIYSWFGIASFIVPFLFFIAGFKIVFQYSILPFWRTIRVSIFLLLFISATLGYAFNLHWLGGTFGYLANQKLAQMLGFAGTGLLLGFTGLGFVVLMFKISLAIKPKAPKPVEETLTDNDIQPIETGNAIKNELVSPVVAAAMARIEEPTLAEPIPEPFLATPLADKHQLELEVEDEDDEELEDEEELEEELMDDDFIEVPTASIGSATPTIPAISLPIDIEKPLHEDSPAILDQEDAIQDSPEGPYDSTLDLSSYKFPTLDLLENHGSNKIVVDREELEANKNRIVETLGHYNIDIEKIKATIGPTVTLYEIVPKAGVRISKIKNLEDDIALSLSALGIRIIAPIPGKGTIGIEVPNQKPEMVSMRSILASEKFQNADMDLPIGLGKTVSNEVFVTDLAKMPHLLMAGATGQGKSVGLNAVLVSLLYKKHPSQVKFVLVDPKKVELTLFKTIERHFLAKLPGEEEAIITDTKKVVNTLNSLCIEMDNRYDLLKDAQVRNIKEYNAKFVARRLNPLKGHRFLPYIILVVDEFADLIMTAGKEVEMPIARLAQLARAIGIHLIIATQRPSVNIITGTIKANFPARIAFRVTSKIDSRTILDAGGADQLIGRGDMLVSLGADLIRIQCAFVDTPEVEKITEYIGSQRGYADAFLLPEYVDEKGEGNADFSSTDRDSLFDDAARIIVQNQQGSASLLQRKLKLGYNRAGRLIDQLEAAGIVGSFEGSKSRDVLIKDMMSLEERLASYR